MEKERRQTAYERFKETHPERLAELRRKASKKYYEAHKDEIREKRRQNKQENFIVF